MKEPPTLADALVAWSCHRHAEPTVAQHCRAMLPARKFVIDESMVRYWADMEVTLTSKKRSMLTVLEAIRKQARLPHKLIWIEHDPRPYRDQTIKKYGFIKAPGARTVMRRGWLVEQHPSLETAFRCTEYNAHENMKKDLEIDLIGFAWCSDDSTVVPWPQYQHPKPWRSQATGKKTERTEIPDSLMGAPAPEDYEWSDSEMLAGATGYITKQVHLIDAVTPELRNALMKRFYNWDNPSFVWKHRASARALWLLLATINDIPITVEHIQPSKGYISRGSYKKFLAHSVVHLNVPETKWRKIIAKALIALRRRAHQVRGHWRKDWRHPLSRLCEHNFNDDMICQRCGGHKIWIAEHQRGDASLGFVTHDYAIHHNEA